MARRRRSVPREGYDSFCNAALAYGDGSALSNHPDDKTRAGYVLV